MGVSTKFGNLSNPTLSPRYVGFWPCFQAAPDSVTTLIDRSGKGNHAAAGPSGIGASAFSTASMFKSSNAASTGALLPRALLAAHRWRSSPAVVRDSLVWSARVNIAALNSTTADTIMRTGTSASTGGWWLEPNNSAAAPVSGPGVRLKLYDTSLGAIAPMGFASLPQAAEATVGFILDGPGNQFYLAVNGVVVPASALTNGTNPASLSTLTGSMEISGSALDPYFGQPVSGAGPVMNMRGCHIAIVPFEAGPIPDPAALLLRLHNHAFTALAASELP